MNRYLKTSDNDDCIFHSNGAFSLILRSSFGASFVKQLALRLHSIERLRFFVEVLRRRKFKIGKVSPSQVSFSYGDDAGLSADISYMLLDNPSPGAMSGALMLSAWPMFMKGLSGFSVAVPVGVSYRFY